MQGGERHVSLGEGCNVDEMIDDTMIELASAAAFVSTYVLRLAIDFMSVCTGEI